MENEINFVIIAVTSYLVAANFTGFIMMGIDKKRAIRKEWRISEAALFTAAFLGGSLGCILGMNHFRHKTKHWYFKYGMPLIFLLQLVLACFTMCIFAG